MNQRLGGRFVLGRKIGSGGMSTVYLGTDEVLDRSVAVKVLKSEFVDSEVGARFRREGRTAARLSHPNIVQTYDAGEEDLDGENVSYIVMEHVSGGDLKQLVKEKGQLPGGELSRVGADIAAGLAHAHERGIVHRDIKPQNVLLDEYGNPKVADFGIARALDSTQATQTGVYLGTALYSSPEQLQGEEVTPKSDVFSLGITLYEAATGGPPFKGTPIEIVSQQINTTPEPPRSRGARISPGLEALILRCLEKEPDRRPDASELGEKLLQAGAAPTAGAGSGPAKGAAGVAALAALLAAGAAGAAGVGRAGRAAGAAGRAGAGALGKRLRPPSPIGTDRPPARTMTVPTRTFRPRWNSTTASWVAAGVLLALLLVGFLFALEQRPNGMSDQRGVAAGTVAGENSAESSNPAPRAAAPPETTARPVPEEEPLTDVAAAQSVLEMYVALGQQDYEASYEYLSEGYKENSYPTVEAWEQENSDFRAMRPINEPTSQVSDGEATVEADIQVIRSNGITQESGVWTLVEENGRWKIDDISTEQGQQNPVQEQVPGQGAGGDEGDGEEGEDD